MHSTLSVKKSGVNFTNILYESSFHTKKVQFTSDFLRESVMQSVSLIQFVFVFWEKMLLKLSFEFFTSIEQNFIKLIWFNLINILRTAFTPADPKSIKYPNDFTVFFTLLGSTSVKC